MTTNYENLRKIMTGDITVKYICGNEIRRISINQTPTYDELCLMTHRLFAPKISNVENIILRYTDEDGDLVVLADDMDIIHAISQSKVLKVTVYDKENHPPPRDLWNQTWPQSLSSADVARLKDELLDMRGVLDTLISSISANKPENGHQSGSEQEEATTYKRLSTNDMAEFLVESNEIKKDASKPTAKITSPKPISPPTQRQSGFSYPQAVAPTSTNPPATPSSYQYQAPYKQQAPPAPSYPQQQHHQQTAPPPSSQAGYASAPSLGMSGYPANAPAPSPGSYGHPTHPSQATQGGQDYYQNRPPATPNNFTQSTPASSSFPQQAPPPHAPQQAPPRPAYGYSETGRWR